MEVHVFAHKRYLACGIGCGPEGIGGGIGAVDGEVEGGPGAVEVGGGGDGDVVWPGGFWDGFTVCQGGGGGGADGPEEVFGVGWGVVDVGVVAEGGCNVLGPVVWTLGTVVAFCADDE